jgi:oligogalacturonide lyase
VIWRGIMSIRPAARRPHLPGCRRLLQSAGVCAGCLILTGVNVPAEPAPRQWVEADSGRRVVRLSPDSGATKLYFHQNAFTAAGDKMVLATGRGLSAVDLRKLPNVSLAVLTTEPAASVIVGAKSRRAYFLRDGKVWALSLDGGKEAMLGPLPESMRRCAGFALNADETLLAGSFVAWEDAPGGESAPRPPRAAGFEATWAARLPRRLFTFEIQSGSIRTFHPANDWLNHVQFSPSDPGLLMFCHEGPWHKVDRIWTIRSDGSQATLRHRRSMEGEIAGHEFFSPDGKMIWFDLQTPRSRQFWLAGVDLASGALTKYSLTKREWSVHYAIAADGKLFAGDGGGPGSVAKGDNGQWIYLFTPKDGRLVSERLVDLSAHDYELEPNVNFTPDGKWIVFQSNRHGSRHVYAVEVAQTGGGGEQTPEKPAGK